LHRLIISILGLVLSISALRLDVAYGYLLPPQQLLEFVADRTGKIYNFRFEAEVESPDPDVPDSMIKKEVVYYAARPDLLRLETEGEADDSTVLSGGGKRLVLLNGQLSVEPARHEDIFALLLHADSPQTLEMLLTEEHVDLSQVHLGRLGKQIAYVIGGSPRQVGVPQFWCDQDNFWPIRLIGRRSSSGVDDLVDIRFLAYQEVAGSVWLPTVIEFYRQDQLFCRMTVQTISFNEKLPHSLFDIDKFVVEHPPVAPPTEPTEKPAEELEEMRRYLEKKYE
jgi:outer membrane lipoprotein-sorting protein